MSLVSFLAFLGMVAIVTWAFLRYIKERDQLTHEQKIEKWDAEFKDYAKKECPKHARPWVAPDDQGIWYCAYWDETFGAEYDYGCPQPAD